MAAIIAVTTNAKRKFTYEVVFEASGQQPDLVGNPIAGFQALGDARAFAMTLAERVGNYENVTVKGLTTK